MTFAVHRDQACIVVFAPALLIYLAVLFHHINQTPIIGSVELYVSGDSSPVQAAARVEVASSGYQSLDGIAWITDEACACSYAIVSESKTGYLWKWEEGKGLLTLGRSLYRNMQVADASSARSKPTGVSRIEYATGIELIVCDSGSRSVSRVFANMSSAKLVDEFRGRALHGPAAALLSRDQTALYFIDPVEDQDADVGMDAAGVSVGSSIYMLPMDPGSGAAGPAVLIDGSLSAPRGMVMSSDEKIMYVSNAAAEHAVVRSFVIDPGGMLHDAGTVFDLNKWIRRRGAAPPPPQLPGLRGLAMDALGRLFVAGHDGVFVLPPGGGEPLAFIQTGLPVNNLALANEEGYLYMTSDSAILRVPVSAYY